MLWAQTAKRKRSEFRLLPLCMDNGMSSSHIFLCTICSDGADHTAGQARLRRTGSFPSRKPSIGYASCNQTWFMFPSSVFPSGQMF